MVILWILIVLISLLLYYSIKKPHNFPPGPFWLPVIGCTLHLQKVAKKLKIGNHVLLQELCNQWKTNVLGLKLGEQLIVSVSSYSIIKNVFKNEAFDARPNNFFAKLRQVGRAPGITCAEGSAWSEQRKFFSTYLRHLGTSALEHKIREELDNGIDLIDSNNSEVNIGTLLQRAVINIKMSFTAGKRINTKDPKFLELVDILGKRVNAFDMAGGILASYPWLRFIAPEKVGFNLINKVNSDAQKFIRKIIDQHHETWTPRNNSDLIYSFITEMKDVDKQSISFTNDQLLMLCIDLFMAGAHSSSGSLDFAFLLMLHYPDIQKKVQNELDANFGKNHVYKYADKHKLPYTEAVLSEVLRFRHVFPIAGSRRATKDTEIGGYSIPKGTTILINLYSVFMSKEIWGDPENFRPERFLDEKHKKLITFPEFVPFSIGRRKCPGESLARMFIFIFFAEFLKRYTILSISGQPLPTLIPRIGISSFPQPYSARFVPRRNHTCNVRS